MYNKGFTISRSGCLVNIDFEFVHLQQKIFPKSGFCIYLGKHCQLASRCRGQLETENL